MFDNLFSNDNKKKQQVSSNVGQSSGSMFSNLNLKDVKQPTSTFQQKQKPVTPQQPNTNTFQNLLSEAEKVGGNVFNQVKDIVKKLPINPLKDKQVVSPIPQSEQLQKKMVSVPAIQNQPIGQGGSLKDTYTQAMKDLSLGTTPKAYAPSSKKNLNQLYQQNIQKIKTQPVLRLQHDTTNFILGMMQGWTNDIVNNPVKNMTSEDAIIKPIAQMAGGAVSISKIGGTIDKILSAGSLGKFLDSTKALKFMKGILSNVSAMDIYGQLDPRTKDRLNQLKNDSIQGTFNGLLEPISNLKASVPVSFAGGVGLAMMNGSDIKSALVNGVIMASLDASGKLGAKSPLPDEPTTQKSTFVMSNAKGLSDEELYAKQREVQQQLQQNPNDKKLQGAAEDIRSEIGQRKTAQIQGQTTKPVESPQTGKPTNPQSDITQYRDALNNRDVKTLNELGAKNPNDPRFHVHEKVAGLSQQITPTEGGTSQTTTTELKPVGQGKETTSGLGKSVESSALAKEMKLNLGDLPTHRTMNMEEKANKSIDLLNSDSTRAKRIAMGHEEAPSDIPAGFIFNAVKNRAIEEGDIDTIRELGTSQAINDFATALGQQVKAFDDTNRNQEDPTKYIRAVSKAKQEAFKNKLRGKASAKDVVNKTVDEIKQQVNKKTPDKKQWSFFIDSLKC